MEKLRKCIFVQRLVAENGECSACIFSIPASMRPAFSMDTPAHSKMLEEKGCFQNRAYLNIPQAKPRL
jgi:hypothetical protein